MPLINASELRVFASAAAGAAVFFAGHVVTFRYLRASTLKRGFLPPLALGLIACMSVWLAQGGAPATEANALASSALAVFLYGACTLVTASFFAITYTSLRVRMLHELARRGGSASWAELSSSYNAGNLLRFRLARLETGGFLQKAPDGYRLGSLGMLHTELMILKLLSRLLGPKVHWDFGPARERPRASAGIPEAPAK